MSETTTTTPLLSLSIDSPENWWLMCEDRWDHILNIFQLVGLELDLTRYPIAVNDEPVERRMPLLQYLEFLKRVKDHYSLIRLFNLAWDTAPDSPHIHQWPSWGVFCDLCSEEWVFQEE